MVKEKLFFSFSIILKVLYCNTLVRHSGAFVLLLTLQSPPVKAFPAVAKWSGHFFCFNKIRTRVPSVLLVFVTMPLMSNWFRISKTAAVFFCPTGCSQVDPGRVRAEVRRATGWRPRRHRCWRVRQRRKRRRWAGRSRARSLEPAGKNYVLSLLYPLYS